MWPLFPTVLELNLSNEDKVMYYNLVANFHNLKFEKGKPVEFLQLKIQELLSLPMRRNEGLVLMFVAIDQDSTLYIENWGPIVIASLKCPDPYINAKKLTLDILNKIVANFSRESVYNDAFQKFIPDILPLLLSLDNEIYKHCCNTLSVCMKYIPQIVGPHQVEIERFLLKKLDSTCTETIEAITECFAALPLCQVCFKKAAKSTYGDMWLDIYRKILNTIRLLLNNILRIPGDDNKSIDAKHLDVFEIPIRETGGYNVLSNIRIFSTLYKCLAKMMSSETCRVQVPIEDLLLSLQRVFQVTNVIKNSNQDQSQELMQLAFPIMLNAVFVVLEAVILNFPIIEQCSNIVTVIRKSLEGMCATSFSENSICRVRSTVWKFSNIWLTQYGRKGSSEIVREKYLIQEVLKDIALDNTDGKLQKLSNGIKSEVTLKDKVLVCAEALKVLRTMIQIGSCFMEKDCMNKISSTVINVARQLLLHLNPSKQFPLPYSDEKCRKRLYDLLLTCSIADDPLQTKCVTKSVNIFRIALKDPSIKVSEVCNRGIIYCRFFLNPKKPPPDVVGFSKSDIFNRHVPATTEMVKENWQNPSFWGRSSDVDMSNEETQNQDDEDDEEEDAYNNTDESIREVRDQEDDDDQDYNYRAESDEMRDLDDRNQDEVEELYSSEVDSSQVNISNVVSSHGEPQMVELRTEKHASEEREANVPTYHNSHENAMHTNQNCADSEFEDEDGEEEIPATNYEKENVNGMEYVEEEDYDHDDDDDDNEEEEVNEECGDEYISDKKHSVDHYDDRVVKRQKIMTEAEADETEVNNNSSPSASSSEDGTEIEAQVNNKYSPRNKKTNTLKSISDEENQNDSERAIRSPTIKEMCGDFVLAEPEPTEES